MEQLVVVAAVAVLDLLRRRRFQERGLCKELE
jgi:hypothetical protein